MRIDRLRLNNYRNYSGLRLEPSGGANVIVGDNAQGKTNALEAVFLCAFARSHRTPRDAELIKKGEAGGYVGAEVSGGVRHTIEFKLRAGENKQLIIDSRPASRSGELMGLINVVMFSPEDLSLVKRGPDERRRFMDMELSQLNPGYYYQLQQYNRALRQRNALLKAEPGREQRGALSAFEGQLSRLGAAIVLMRRDFIMELGVIASGLHAAISGNKERLEVGYRPGVPIAPDADAGEVQQALLDALALNAMEDMRRGFTSVGPHRDDVALTVDGSDVRAFSSQGQQRTAALSLKLSELTLLKRRLGRTPVLLLDDVFSELDDSRQRLLVGAMQGCQSFLTCTSLAGIAKAGLSDITAFECVNGTLTRIRP